MTRLGAVAFVACFVVIFIATDLSAQAPGPERSGLAGGFSLGFGRLGLGDEGIPDPALGFITSDQESRGALALNLRLGAMVTPRTAVFFEFGGADSLTLISTGGGRLTVGPDQVDFGRTTTGLTAYTMTGSVQYFLTSRIWTRGGLGGGMLDRNIKADVPDMNLTVSKTGGLALLGAAGVEVWRRNNFAADVQFHFTTFKVEGIRINAPTVQFGVNFY